MRKHIPSQQTPMKYAFAVYLLLLCSYVVPDSTKKPILVVCTHVYMNALKGESHHKSTWPEGRWQSSKVTGVFQAQTEGSQCADLLQNHWGSQGVWRHGASTHLWSFKNTEHLSLQQPSDRRDGGGECTAVMVVRPCVCAFGGPGCPTPAHSCIPCSDALGSLTGFCWIVCDKWENSEPRFLFILLLGFLLELDCHFWLTAVKRQLKEFKGLKLMLKL